VHETVNMNIDNKVQSTQKMQLHQKAKAQASATTMRREEVDLRDTGLINVKQSTALNACSDHGGLADVLETAPTKVLLSDVDEQLLFRISFEGVAAITQLRFKVPAELPEDSSAPLSVKVFVNRDNMDFSDADDLAPVATRELAFADGEATFPVSGPHFSRVSSLQVLVENNVDDTEKTVVSQFSVLGHIIPQYM
jgi:hypothetical protein